MLFKIIILTWIFGVNNLTLPFGREGTQMPFANSGLIRDVKCMAKWGDIEYDGQSKNPSIHSYTRYLDEMAIGIRILNESA